MTWEVWRHGGAANHRWRLVLRTEDETEARQRYRDLAVVLRQGGVRLFRVPDGGEPETAEAVWAPCLRTRW